MAKRMLIDATHPEETRVVVVNGNKLEELDFEIASRRPIKGNIYLARVTRVEPSLQAAFVEYGGNRHGFLAFSEIHPDYYRIPVADREALDADEQSVSELPEPRETDISAADEFADEEDNGNAGNGFNGGADRANADRNAALDGEILPPAYADEDGSATDNGNGLVEQVEASGAEAGEGVEQVGGDEVEEARQRRHRSYRNYKIQEVIKRRQIMLVQVTKEERGNKGAALTTYLSLAGRYCVLMPNTPRGGGVSRKITNQQDRKRLKELLDDLDLPEGMSVILRTAGMERTKQEIKRDLDYLLRLWDSIRERTLAATAPALIHEEGDLIKRSIRDLYGRDVDEIWVEGEEGYRVAKDQMRMLMPSHAKKVQPYRDDFIPLFMRHQVESQIDAIHNPVVQLKSGGYIVINQTEALVAIDVNSGRATRERNIEETATKTNLEAAEEVARQLRLRDMAGLIVIDFIDMEDSRNNAAVERKLKEAMKADRARIQIGRISPFGLLELSRQRLRPSLVETHFERCAQCQGLGLVRSTESAAMEVLRAVQEEGIRRRSAEISVTVPTAVALYILNQLRPALADLERRYAFRVLVTADGEMVPPVYRLDRIRSKTPEEIAALAERPTQEPVQVIEDEEQDATEDEAAETEELVGADANGEDERRRKRRRRRRRRRGDGPADNRPDTFAVLGAPEDGAEAGEPEEDEVQDGGQDASREEGDIDAQAKEGEEQRRRRRGKRGGRRRRRDREGGEPAVAETAQDDEATDDAVVVPPPVRIPPLPPLSGPVEVAHVDDLLDLSGLDAPAAEPAVALPEAPQAGAAEEAPAKRKRTSTRKRKTATAETAPDAVTADAPAAAEPAPSEAAAPEAAPKRKRTSTPRKRKAAAEAEPANAETPDAAPAAAEPPLAEPVAVAPAEPTPALSAARSDKAQPATGAAAPAEAPATEAAAAEGPAVNVNRPPEKPKRGWWNRLMG
ncbi:MAG TPA: ribonuclease E/G [Azospirillaceae bacterium]|nr:ribonuclease E/G [Azospirillaceae bacterium]